MKEKEMGEPIYDQAIALKKSPELIRATEANRLETIDRINQGRIPAPWPVDAFCRIAGLQPIKSHFDSLNRAYRVKRGVFRGGLILASVATYGDQLWYHVSFSLKDKIPSYEQTIFVRQALFGPDLKVIQVFPPLEEHYNLHPNCLHLWACLEGDCLPDFRTLGAV